MNNRLDSISLFSGWGGGDAGFHRAGFNTRLAVDFNRHARECLKLQFPGVDVQGWDLIKVKAAFILQHLGVLPLQLPFMLMSPSCQGISISGKFDPYDSRNLLLLRCLSHYVPRILPRCWLLENVSSIDKGRMLIFYDMVREQLSKLNEEYHIEVATLNALHYGTPQCRERFFIMGTHKSLNVKPSFPEPDLAGAKNLTIHNTLPDVDGVMTGYGFTKFKHHSEYFPTMTSTVNFQLRRNGRNEALTCDEILKVCGYPEDWAYTGGVNLVWARAGNSIMPRMAHAIACHIRDNILCPDLVQQQIPVSNGN